MRSLPNIVLWISWSAAFVAVGDWVLVKKLGHFPRSSTFQTNNPCREDTTETKGLYV